MMRVASKLSHRRSAGLVNREEHEPEATVLRTPRWFTSVSSFAGSLDLGTTPDTSFAGVNGSDGECPSGATRAAGHRAIDEVSTAKTRDKPSRADAEGRFLLGSDSRSKGQTRGAPSVVL
jgi:hypothetical protein